jgi:hypothetical protein
MSEERTTKIASINANISTIKYCQQCMLCNNTRTLPEGMHYCSTSWVCDECKEAMAFVKDFMKSYNIAQDMLNEINK